MVIRVEFFRLQSLELAACREERHWAVCNCSDRSFSSVAKVNGVSSDAPALSSDHISHAIDHPLGKRVPIIEAAMADQTATRFVVWNSCMHIAIVETRVRLNINWALCNCPSNGLWMCFVCAFCVNFRYGIRVFYNKFKPSICHYHVSPGMGALFRRAVVSNASNHCVDAWFSHIEKQHAWSEDSTDTLCV